MLQNEYVSILGVALLIYVSACNQVIAQSVVSNSETRPRNNIEDYNVLDYACGVTALVAGARLLGVDDVSVQDMAITPDYLTLREGSSIAQLQAAADTLGINTLAVDDLTISYVENSPFPIIVHVSRIPLFDKNTEELFDHFELLIDVKDGKATLFDVSKELYTEDLTALYGRMSGRGLLLSKEPIEMEALTKTTSVQKALYAIGAMLGCIALLFVFSPNKDTSTPENMSANS